MKEFLFLNNNCKHGSSFILKLKKDKVFILTEHGEYESLEPKEFLHQIITMDSTGEITLIGKVVGS